jgi:hypothetical protein
MMEPQIATATAEQAVSEQKPAAASAVPTAQQLVSLRVLRAEWTTLAVLPTAPGISAREVAAALAETARAHRLCPVRVLAVAAAASPPLAPLDELAAARGGDVRTAIAVEFPAARPAAMPAILDADAVLLLVRLGVSELRAVRELAELVGPERVVGCVLVR